eukprot:2170830-Alexandrium_andersonii.AAC.1
MSRFPNVFLLFALWARSGFSRTLRRRRLCGWNGAAFAKSARGASPRSRRGASSGRTCEICVEKNAELDEGNLLR